MDDDIEVRGEHAWEVVRESTAGDVGHGGEKKIIYEWKNAGEITPVHREERLGDRPAAELRHRRLRRHSQTFEENLPRQRIAIRVKP